MEMDISDPPQSIFSEGKINIKKELGDGTLIKSETKGCTFQEGEPSTVKIEPADDILKCKNCGESFLTHKTLNDHNLANHEQDANDIYIKDEMFICEVCEEILGSEADFEDHKLRHLDEHSEDDEDEAENAFVCSVCNAIFESKDDVIGHKKSHSECYEHRKCNKCKDGSSEEFSCLWELIDHVKVQHGLKDEDGSFANLDWLQQKCERLPQCDIYEGPFLCDETSQNLSNKIDGSINERSNSGMQCESCDKSFKFLSDLNRHTMIHTGEKNFSCRLCPKKFNRAYNRKAHERTHTGDRPRNETHKCGVCFKFFARKDILTRHKKVHDGDVKLFPCRYCPKTFNRNSNKTAHERRHIV